MKKHKLPVICPLLILGSLLVLLFFTAGCSTVEEPEPVEVEPVEEQAEEEPAPDVYELVEDLIRRGEHRQALHVFEEHHQGLPEEIGDLLLYSSLCITAGEIEKGEKAVEIILAREPDNGEALYNLVILRSMGGG